MARACAAQQLGSLHVCMHQRGPAQQAPLLSDHGSHAVQEARRCHYTGLLYCASCHTGETARIPALVLHSWEFRKQPVCCLAAQYLAAIHDQPLLDVSAISPGALPDMPGCMNDTGSALQGA